MTEIEMDVQHPLLVKLWKALEKERHALVHNNSELLLEAAGEKSSLITAIQQDSEAVQACKRSEALPRLVDANNNLFARQKKSLMGQLRLLGLADITGVYRSDGSALLGNSIRHLADI